MLTNPPPVYFDPKGGDYVSHVIGVLKQYEAVGVEDPTIGFYADSDSRQGVIANQRFGDGVQDQTGLSPEPVQPEYEQLVEFPLAGVFQDALSAGTVL